MRHVTETSALIGKRGGGQRFTAHARNSSVEQLLLRGSGGLIAHSHPNLSLVNRARIAQLHFYRQPSETIAFYTDTFDQLNLKLFLFTEDLLFQDWSHAV